ncbi:MAG TPA: hypothetical protein VL967_05360 [Terracidiphilus sp.]|nr:hypothetical protein [Terracidiphilus sp.]
MYSRSQNDNTTFNSRCLYCFMTIASDLPGLMEVERAEATHICPEKALARMLANEEAEKPGLHRVPSHLLFGGSA